MVRKCKNKFRFCAFVFQNPLFVCFLFKCSFHLLSCCCCLLFVFGSLSHQWSTAMIHDHFLIFTLIPIAGIAAQPHRCRFHRLKMKWLTLHRAKQTTRRRWPAARITDANRAHRHTVAVHTHAIANWTMRKVRTSTEFVDIHFIPFHWKKTDYGAPFVVPFEFCTTLSCIWLFFFFVFSCLSISLSAFPSFDSFNMHICDLCLLRVLFAANCIFPLFTYPIEASLSLHKICRR